MKEKKYTLTVTESQLWLISHCVEDCHRFAAGQTELNHTTCFMDHQRELYAKLKELKHLVTPELPYIASYGWSGGSCPNKWQREFIARTYAIYREILHQLTIQNPSGEWSVYNSPTLTCDEGGPLPVINKVEGE